MRDGPRDDRGRRDLGTSHLARRESLTVVESHGGCGDAVREDAMHKVVGRSPNNSRTKLVLENKHHLQHALESKQSKTKHQGPVETGRADLDRDYWLRLILQQSAASTSRQMSLQKKGLKEKTHLGQYSGATGP